MKKVLLALAVVCSLAIPGYAQDDCPAGHVRNPQVSSLDHTYMVSAFKASFRGIFGRDPSMIPGSGKDDGEYYISASNHYGVYGDDQCHAGWSGYWEAWLSTGHGDLSLVQTPARFLPGMSPAPVPVPTPVPQPIPSYPVCDLTTVLRAVDGLGAQLDRLDTTIGTIDVTTKTALDEDRSWRAQVRGVYDSIGKPLLKFVLPALGAFLVGRQAAQ